MLAITGFLPGDDPRMKATIDATAARLTDERGLVYRYLAHDGLAGEEGTFLLCTFWLAQAQALAGEMDQATATFERAVAAINDVGLLAEEVDAASGEMIGNFPQAFSHIGLINAAWAITQAQERATRRVPCGGRFRRGVGAQELTMGSEQIPHRSAGTAERALRVRLRRDGPGSRVRIRQCLSARYVTRRSCTGCSTGCVTSGSNWSPWQPADTADTGAEHSSPAGTLCCGELCPNPG